MSLRVLGVKENVKMLLNRSYINVRYIKVLFMIKYIDLHILIQN